MGAGIQVAVLNFSGFLLPAFAGTGFAGMTDLSPENTLTSDLSIIKNVSGRS
jgi:hypothetical protein